MRLTLDNHRHIPHSLEGIQDVCDLRGFAVHHDKATPIPGVVVDAVVSWSNMGEQRIVSRSGFNSWHQAHQDAVVCHVCGSRACSNTLQAFGFGGARVWAAMWDGKRVSRLMAASPSERTGKHPIRLIIPVSWQTYRGLDGRH